MKENILLWIDALINLGLGIPFCFSLHLSLRCLASDFLKDICFPGFWGAYSLESAWPS